ncbi:MAG: hypothetical protein JWM45_78, partial [Pseudonocardiales bacterium]|nr:hypothetical protein [Pseudonocardiales bacterium]
AGQELVARSVALMDDLRGQAGFDASPPCPDCQHQGLGSLGVSRSIT